VGEGHDFTSGGHRQAEFLFLQRFEPTSPPEPKRQALVTGQAIGLGDAQGALQVDRAPPGFVKGEDELIAAQVVALFFEVGAGAVGDLVTRELEVNGRRREGLIVEGQEQGQAQQAQQGDQQVQMDRRSSTLGSIHHSPPSL